MSRSGVIDALRGLAILGVISVHVSELFHNLPWPIEPIVKQGARGVQLFFVLSSLCLLMSWHRRTPTLREFFARRFFRVAPMFYLAIVAYALIDGFSPRPFAPHGVTIADYLAAVTFLHGWLPNAIDSIVPGGWSIACEASFYLIFPALAVWIRELRSALVGLLVSIVIGFGLTYAASNFRGTTDAQVYSDFLYLWPPFQLPAFLVGFVVYFAHRDNILFDRYRVPLAAIGAALLIGLALIHIPILNQTLYAVAFGVLTVALLHSPVTLLNNCAARYIGRVSYSTYFMHFALLRAFGGYAARHMPSGLLGFILLYGMTVISSVALSGITYKFVELPGMGLFKGRRVATASSHFVDNTG
jgi:peptidoglycan/LPS O-acetylase OafA/YrhL